MNSMHCFLAVIVTVVSNFAQGTIEFRSAINSSQALPPNSSSLSASGQFSLFSDHTLVGEIVITRPLQLYTSTIYNSGSALDLGIPIYTLTEGLYVHPDPITQIDYQVYDFNPRVLTQLEIDDLMSGRWWISVASPEFPNGEIRGQLLMVPEPSAMLLMIPALGVVWFFYRRRVFGADSVKL
jgi:hypothetical protein